MNVYSWNMKFNNTKLPEALEFIKNLNFDVICLQEVPVGFHEQLKDVGCEMAYTTDAKDEGGHLHHNLILSHFPIVHWEDFSLPLPTAPLRTKLIIKAMYPYGWEPLIEKRALYADVKTPTGTVRVFSLHLTLLGPKNRLNEFAAAFKKMDAIMPTIVVGDFNIIEYSLLKTTNWLLGSPFNEGLPWYSERRVVEKLFGDHGLRNLLRGRVTHHFSDSQLDHLLVSKEFDVEKVWIEKKTYGSDHQPVGMTISLQNVSA